MLSKEITLGLKMSKELFPVEIFLAGWDEESCGLVEELRFLLTGWEAESWGLEEFKPLLQDLWGLDGIVSVSDIMKNRPKAMFFS